MDQSKSLYLNVYEICIDEDFLKEPSLIEAFLYECQCSLFLVDITNKNSFKLIKELINLIKPSNFPYLKKILVLNKLDLEVMRQISSFEIKEYLNSNTSIDSQEISIKNGKNLKELLKK